MTLFPLETDRSAQPATADSADPALDRSVQRTFIAGFESTFLPGADIDVAEATGGVERWAQDVAALEKAGVRRVRYPFRWHRIAQEPGAFDWSTTDAELEELRSRGFEPIVDLVHHTSHPRRLEGGFGDPRFASEYLRFTEAVAARYPWLPAYTVFNEPFATLFLAGHEALWPPYEAGEEGFAHLATAVLPAIAEAAGIMRAALPDAEHVWIDTAESHAGAPEGHAEYAAFANDRRHVLLDLLLGTELDPRRPALASLLLAGGESLLDLPRVQVDVLGLDYYAHSEWWYDNRGSHAPSPFPRGFAAVAADYFERYGLPMILGETNVRGLPSDRATWLRIMLHEYERAVDAGLPMSGFTWFPFVDSCDWDSLLARAAGRRDPVGVWDVAPGGRRVRTVFTVAWELAAAGAPVDALPAYRFQSPNDVQLEGHLAGREDWPWREAPALEPPMRPMPVAKDLVVLSHLRWDWVWQRPQHLVSRFAADRQARGGRTWFVEEPIADDLDTAELRIQHIDGVSRVQIAVPRREGQPALLSFDEPNAAPYGRLLRELLAEEGVRHPDVLVYTPMALDIARTLEPHRLAYDVMDDLASFADPPKGMRQHQEDLLAEADVVFAGGRSLHRWVADRRPDCHLFPSGVDVAHYAVARELRRERVHLRPVAGYVGVLDERLDLDLVARLAEILPDWTIRMVGPVAKIDPASLPQAPNIEYPGMTDYELLPTTMADFDVALMPFALNQATRSISPTKTLEYLAAGLPVVSTRIADVVADYGGVVHLADDGAAFAEACRAVVEDPVEARDRRARMIGEHQTWDAIAEAIGVLVELPTPPATRADEVHIRATAAAIAGLGDAALGSARLAGPMVPILAEAAVSSATPFLRAPLLGRLAAVQRLHPLLGGDDGNCPSCCVPAPCPTAELSR